MPPKKLLCATVRILTLAGASLFLQSQIFAQTYSLELDNTDAQVVIVDDADYLNLTGEVTIEAWIKPTISDVNYRKIMRHGQATDVAYGLQYQDGYVHFTYYNIAQGGWQGVATLTTIPINTWTHVAAVRENDNTIKMYVNGAFDSSGIGYAPDDDGNGDFTIGASNIDMVGLTIIEQFEGLIDEVKVWDIARTGNQIANSYNMLLPSNTPHLIGYYIFEEGTGFTTSDITGINPDGILNGSIAWSGDGPTLLEAPALWLYGGIEQTNIYNQSFTPNISDNTFFGYVSTSTTVSRTFQIDNNGAGDLDISSIYTDNPRFTVTGFTPNVVGAGLTTFFTVLFTPAATGPETAVVTIESNDPLDEVFEFAVQAEGVTYFQTAQPGLWFDLATWGNVSSLPTSLDDVVIAHDVVLDASASVNNFDLSGGVQFDFTNQALEVLGNLQIDGTLLGSTGASLSLNGSSPQALDFGCQNVQTVIFGGSGIKSMTGSGFDVQELLWIRDDAVLQANGIRIALEQNANWLEQDNAYFDPGYDYHTTYLRGFSHSITSNIGSRFGYLHISSEVTFNSDIDAVNYVGQNDVVLNLGAHTLYVRSNWQFDVVSSFSLSYDPGAAIDFSQPGYLYFGTSGSEPYPDVRISGGGNVNFYGSAYFGEDLNIDNGQINSSNISMYFTGNSGINIGSGSLFNISGTSNINLDLGQINNHGSLLFEGWGWESHVSVTGNGFTIVSDAGGADIGATYTNFSGLSGDGISILGGTVNSFPYNFSNTRLAGTGTALLTFGDVEVTDPIENVEFYSGATYNVQKLAGSQTIILYNAFGDLAGEAFENEASGDIEWASAADIYVKSDAFGNNDGSSWADAFVDLQTALAAAVDGNQIWIANGTYKPDDSDPGNTALSFIVSVNDLSIFGGFSGTESSLAERYADPLQTVLTGDLNGDDDLSFSNVLDNANNVVLINNVTGVYIDGLTIKGGNAAAYGGGISSSGAEFTLNQVFVEYCLAGTSGGGAYVVGGDVAILNSHFQNNYATTGGGAYLNASEPFIYRSVFQYNDAVSGGGLYLEGSNLIDNSVSYYNKFLNNGATAVTGGGVYLEESYFEAFQNLFADNYAYDYGGAINVDNLSTFTSVNSTVADNASNDGSGGLNFSSGATIRIDNTIFWGNTSVAQLASYQSINDGGAFVINHSIVQEWDKNIYSSAAANNVNGLDPMFVNSANGDYRLLLASPAIDLGNDMLLEQLFYIDIFDEDQDADYLEYAPFDLAKNPRYYGSSVDVGAYEHQGNPDPVALLYVNGSALGNNDGSSWADAFTDLQDALASATEGTEIWVAAGTYYPSGDDPSVSFVIPSGASIYGGFNGTETSLSERDIVSNNTILEGDSPNFLNSYLVVYIAGTGNNARLDGFTISGGNGEYGTDNYGGGIKIEGGAEPILANLTIQLNQNDFGAGLYVNGGIVTIDKSNFVSNAVINFGTGGAIYADNAVLIVTNTRFENNTAWEAGGVYLSNSSSLTAVNIDFDTNSAFGLNGGALEAVDSDVSIANGRFYNNYGNPGAGILFSSTSADHDLELNQTTFTTTYSSDGVAIRSSGGFYSSAIINNSIFWANVGSQISIVDDGSNLSVSSSIIDGWNISDYSGFSGSIIEANIGTGDPLFTNILTGDLTITDGSSAQDFGSVILLPFDDLDIDGDHVTVEILPLDLAGNPRVSNAQVDAGAYEIQVASIPFTVTASDAEVASADHLYPETDFVVAGVSVNVTEATVLNMMRYTTNTDLMASLAGYKLVHSTDATFSTAGDNVVVASSPLASMTDLEFSSVGYSLSVNLHHFFLVASTAIEANQTQPGITFSLDENDLTFDTGAAAPFSYTSPVSTFSAAPTYSTTLQNSAGSEVNISAGTSDVTLMELLVGADPYGEVTNLVVNFSQDPGTNLQNYRLVVSFDNSLATTFDNDIINGSNLTGSSVAFGPIAGGIYAAGKSFFVVADVPASAPGIPSPITFSVDDASFTTAFGSVSGINITSDPFRVAVAISALPATSISTFGFTANWNLAAGVDGYRLEVSEDALFTNLLPGFEPLELTAASVDVSGLYHATTYFYRVKAFTGTVETSYSNAVEVKTLKSVELTSDSTALVNIYDQMGGAGWTNSANWKATQVRGWSGVVVENSRVTALNLSSNNVTGAFPTLTDTELDALQQLDLSNNQVTTVLANANLGVLQVLDLSSNQLDFGSLEQFASVPTFTYSPQAALFTAVDLLQERGEALSIDRTSAGASNQYQWYKNGTAVDGATGPVYTIAFPTFAEEGSYTALVTNSLLPNLTLTTLPINLRVSSLERDRLILTELYNLTAGDSWNNSTNWNTADIGSWFGVTVANDRVTGITLGSNNLVGELPARLGDMRRLTAIDISNNEVSSLPALTNIIELTTLNVSNNRLQFDDLEPNVGIGSINYAPQKLTGQAREEKIAVNTAVTVEVPVGGTANSYQWYRNGSPVAAGTSSSYQVGPIRYENMGSYELEITSNKVAGLTLRSEVQRVLGTATITGSIVDLNNASVVNANGALLGVKTGAYDTTGFYNSAANGGFEIKDIVLGDYLLYGEQDKQVYIPSYYRSTIDWVFADLIQLRDNIGDLVLTMVNVPRELTPADGDNTFKGLFESDFGDTGGKVLDRKRVQGAGVSVSRSRFRAKDNEDDYELIAYVQTDGTGQFEMNNLPDGDYRVNIQYPGIPMDPSSFIDFQLGGGSGVEQNSIRINALATPTSIVVTKVEETGIYLDYFKGLTVYPNPATDYITIRYEKLIKGRVEAELINMTGQTLRSTMLNTGGNEGIRLDVTELRNGMYILRFHDLENNGVNITSFKVWIDR